MGEELRQDVAVTAAATLRNRRRVSDFKHTTSTGVTVRLKIMDMTEMVLYDLVPLPMLNAVDEFEKMQQRLKSAVTDDEKRDRTKEFMSGETRQKFEAFLDRWLCAAVIEPVITLEDDKNPEHVPVSQFNFLEKLDIWNASPDLKEEAAVVTPDQAYEFRGAAQDSARTDVPDGESVRPEAELVDTPERSYIHA